MAAILDTGRRWRTQFWKGTTQGSFQQSLVEIGSVVSEEKIFFKFHPPFSIFSLAAIWVGSRDHRTQFLKGTIQGSFHKSLVVIGPVVSEEKIFMWISHRVLCLAKFGCGGHLDRRAEPPDTFLEENHPMTISSKFCSYWSNGFRQEDFYGNFPEGPMLN
jgi:adenylate kinase family enzyme